MPEFLEPDYKEPEPPVERNPLSSDALTAADLHPGQSFVYVVKNDDGTESRSTPITVKSEPFLRIPRSLEDAGLAAVAQWFAKFDLHMPGYEEEEVTLSRFGIAKSNTEQFATEPAQWPNIYAIPFEGSENEPTPETGQLSS